MTRKNTFFKVWSWLKFNNLGLSLYMVLKFYTSVEKGLKLNVRKFLGLISTFVGVTWGKNGSGAFLLPPSLLPLILNRVMSIFHNQKTPSLNFKSSCSQMFLKIGIFRKFRNIHRKTPVLELLLTPAILLKRDSNTGISLWILRNF